MPAACIMSSSSIWPSNTSTSSYDEKNVVAYTRIWVPNICGATSLVGERVGGNAAGGETVVWGLRGEHQLPAAAAARAPTERLTRDNCQSSDNCQSCGAV